MILHRIWLVISGVGGLPIAGLSMLLLVPAAHERSPVIVLLFIPVLLVVWSITLFVRFGRDHAISPAFRRWLLPFYIVTGATVVWVTTWSFSRDGRTEAVFSPWSTLIAGGFFLLPVVHLLFFCKTRSSEPDGSATRSQPFRSETTRTSSAAGSDR
jgi:hypothetical protein